MNDPTIHFCLRLVLDRDVYRAGYFVVGIRLALVQVDRDVHEVTFHAIPEISFGWTFKDNFENLNDGGYR